MEGLFSLKTPADLREKLRRDLAKLLDAPLDADAAFNFFITAEHMLDWVYPNRVRLGPIFDCLTGANATS